MSTQWQDRLVGKVRLPLLSRSALAGIAVFTLVVTAFAPPTSTLVLAAQSADKLAEASLAGCPARKPALRVAGHFNEEFTPHPAENRFGTIHFTRLHQMPLFGADPRDENIDKALRGCRSLGIPAWRSGAHSYASRRADLQ